MPCATLPTFVPCYRVTRQCIFPLAAISNHQNKKLPSLCAVQPPISCRAVKVPMAYRKDLLALSVIRLLGPPIDINLKRKYISAHRHYPIHTSSRLLFPFVHLFAPLSEQPLSPALGVFTGGRSSSSARHTRNPLPPRPCRSFPKSAVVLGSESF